MKWQVKPISFYILHLTAFHPGSIPSVSLISNTAQILKQTLCCSSKLLIHPDPTARITPPLCWLSQNSRCLHQFWTRSKGYNVVREPNFRRDQLMPVLNFTESLGGAEKGKKPQQNQNIALKKIRFFPALFLKLRVGQIAQAFRHLKTWTWQAEFLERTHWFPREWAPACLENPLGLSPFFSSWSAPGS